MKRALIALVLGLSLIAPAVYADEATSTPVMYGSLNKVAVGNVDSTHGKGAWVLENSVATGYGRISYLAEASGAELVRLQSLFSSWINFYTEHSAK